MSNVYSTIVLIGDTVNKLPNAANGKDTIKNPNWWEADQLAFYTTQSWSWTRDYREQIQIAVGWRIWTRDLQVWWTGEIRTCVPNVRKFQASSLHEALAHLQFLLGKSLVFIRINHCIISLKGDYNQSDHGGKSSNPREDPSCQQFAHDCTTHSPWVVASDCQHNFWRNKRCVHHISYSQVH